MSKIRDFCQKKRHTAAAKADGDYPLLSEAIKGGLFHPRCKDSTSTYFEGITNIQPMTDEEIAEMERREKLEQKESYYKNQAEKNRRIAEHSLDGENKRTYAHRAEQSERKAQAVKKLQTEELTVIDSWEAENYDYSTEKGLLITSDGKKIDFGGTDHHVTGKSDDIKLMDGATFTHNHPTDNTFSQNDIVTGLVKGNLKELRAVTSTGDVHILVNNGATEEQRKKFSAAYQQRRMKAANAADSKIRKGERLNKQEYVKSRLEAFMSENAKDYNLTYVKSSVEKNEKALANSGESGIISLWDNSTEYKPVTPESIDKVPLLNIFDDDAMNKAHQEASRNLLREVMKHDDLPLGTEFSIVYDENMQPIKGHSYRQGGIGYSKIDKPNVLYNAFHNHGSGQTFSYQDILGFADSSNMISLTATGNNGKNFVLLKSKECDCDGYSVFISKKLKDELFAENDTVFTLQKVLDIQCGKLSYSLIEELTVQQKEALANSIFKEMNDILEGAKDYGIKYLSSSS